ncbi:unnamed protein product [Rotaria magnacalcarata]|uniref:Uncharacterized protein n=1 Tax=Rotaria magnacalcarata TaxID=392030 RepID=A0A815MES1_9BILA|nr:unnamed protein product [Rotaria magnacalcarata]
MNSNVPSDVMELERDTFFDFVKQYSGEKVANLLEFQDITNVNYLLTCKDPLEILLLDSDDLIELKKATCLKLNNNSFTVLPGVKSIGRDRHIVTARKETYMKVPPATIRSSTNMLSYLQSIGINIDTYEHFYPSSPLPTDMQLTEFAVNMIVSNADSIEISHLFNDA